MQGVSGAASLKRGNIYTNASPKVLREFINVLGNSMRIKEIYSMLMTVKEQTDDELSSALNLLSDKMIGE